MSVETPQGSASVPVQSAQSGEREERLRVHRQNPSGKPRPSPIARRRSRRFSPSPQCSRRPARSCSSRRCSTSVPTTIGWHSSASPSCSRQFIATCCNASCEGKRERRPTAPACCARHGGGEVVDVVAKRRQNAVAVDEFNSGEFAARSSDRARAFRVRGTGSPEAVVPSARATRVRPRCRTARARKR